MMLNNQSVLEIIDIDGMRKKVEIVLILTLEKTHKDYIIYTLNQQKDDMVVLYASSILKQNGEIILETISDEEWLLVKDKMRAVIQDKKEDC